MKPNQTISLGTEQTAHLGAVGLQPFESRNIRVSAALCTFGFSLMTESQPATVVIDYETKQRVTCFFHRPLLPEDSPIKAQLPLLTAYMLQMWWADPDKYSIEGYDDALRAMRRVFETREWLIGVIKGKFRVAGDGRRIHHSVTTESLHVASVIKACGIDLLAFHNRTFVFGPAAAEIAGLIDASENTGQSIRLASYGVAARLEPKGDPTTQPDTCVDWMLWGLKYLDWLRGMVRDPGCIPLVEKRDGERALRISSAMPKTLRREFTRRF
jgi:hypothetical protein